MYYRMIKHFTHIILIALLTACGVNRLERKGIYQEVAAEDFAAMAQDPSYLIIDVRTPKEYNKAHVEGAINISYFGDFKDSLKKSDLNTDRPLMIYCETQHRSLFATKILHRHGFKKIVDLDKGMRYYRKMELPYIGEDN